MSLACRGVSASYPGSDRSALRNVSLEVARGRVLGVAGRSGSGKTTLLRCLAGTLAPSTGEVTADGFVAVVQQLPEQQLFAATIADEVAFGPRNQGLDEEEARGRAVQALELLGFKADEAFLERNPLLCSGGEKRRIAIADMVAMRPDYLLLDEPTAGLDPAQAERLVGVVRALAAQGVGVVVVSHDMDVLAAVADDVAIIADGEIAATGPAPSVLGDVDALRNAGLVPSRTVELAARLRSRGVSLPVGILEPRELAAALAAAKRGSASGLVPTARPGVAGEVADR